MSTPDVTSLGYETTMTLTFFLCSLNYHSSLIPRPSPHGWGHPLLTGGVTLCSRVGSPSPYGWDHPLHTGGVTLSSRVGSPSPHEWGLGRRLYHNGVYMYFCFQFKFLPMCTGWWYLTHVQMPVLTPKAINPPPSQFFPHDRRLLRQLNCKKSNLPAN